MQQCPPVFSVSGDFAWWVWKRNDGLTGCDCVKLAGSRSPVGVRRRPAGECRGCPWHPGPGSWSFPGGYMRGTADAAGGGRVFAGGPQGHKASPPGQHGQAFGCGGAVLAGVALSSHSVRRHAGKPAEQQPVDERPGDGAGGAADLPDLPDPEPRVGDPAAPPCCPAPVPGARAGGSRSPPPPPRPPPGAGERGDPWLLWARCQGVGLLARFDLRLKTRVMAACAAASASDHVYRRGAARGGGHLPRQGPCRLWKCSLTRPVAAACPLGEGMFPPKVLTSVLT